LLDRCSGQLAVGPNDSREDEGQTMLRTWFPPPLAEAQVAAIYRHLTASAN
jgi:hypothetical protein